MIPPGRLNAIQNDPRVYFVEPNHPVFTNAQTVPTGITRTNTNTNPNMGINGADDFRINVDVAVIDTGIATHADLNLVGHVDCSGNATTCAVGGTDENGHGTHVAGTIAALDNGDGVVGVAPGARLWGVRVMDRRGNGYVSWTIKGLDWVLANAGTIEVVNMSLGCQCTSAAQNTAIANVVNAGVVVVAAAGNNGANASIWSPGNHPDVITVSAIADFDGVAGGLGKSTCFRDTDDTLYTYSNFGSLIEIAAPGVCIYSTSTRGGYATLSGTSMAAPHVAGAAAILASRSNPNSRADVMYIQSLLLQTGNYNWTDESGDGIKEPLLDLSNASVFAPL
jgi:subtilisin family serine protease